MTAWAAICLRPTPFLQAGAIKNVFIFLAKIFHTLVTQHPTQKKCFGLFPTQTFLASETQPK